MVFELSMEKRFLERLLQKAKQPKERLASSNSGRSQQNIDQPLFGDVRERSSLADPQLCIICCVRPPNVVLAPCYHLVFCKACHAKGADQRCPVCRGPIVSAHETYGV